MLRVEKKKQRQLPQMLRNGFWKTTLNNLKRHKKNNDLSI
jgi:hypothetical protein